MASNIQSIVSDMDVLKGAIAEATQALIQQKKVGSTTYDALQLDLQASVALLTEMRTTLGGLSAEYEDQRKKIASHSSAIKALNSQHEQLMADMKKQKQLNDTLSTSLSKLQKSYDDLSRGRKEIPSDTSKIVGAYSKEMQAMNALEQEYKNLIISKGGLDKMNAKEIAKLAQMEASIKRHAASLRTANQAYNSMGVAAGGAGKQFNELGQSVGFLASEIPNFAISARTGIMAISNNLPMLGQALGNAQKQGKGFVSVLKSVGGALVSPMALFSLFSAALLIIVNNWDSIAKAIGITTEKIETIMNVLSKSNNAIGKSVGRFETLVKIANDTTRSLKEQEDAVKVLKEEYEDFDTQLVASGEAIDAYKLKLIELAESEAAMAKIQELTSKRMEAQRTLREQETIGMEKATAYGLTVRAKAQAKGDKLLMDAAVEASDIVVRAKEAEIQASKDNIDQINKEIDSYLEFIKVAYTPPKTKGKKTGFEDIFQINSAATVFTDNYWEEFRLRLLEARLRYKEELVAAFDDVGDNIIVDPFDDQYFDSLHIDEEVPEEVAEEYVLTLFDKIAIFMSHHSKLVMDATIDVMFKTMNAIDIFLENRLERMGNRHDREMAMFKELQEGKLRFFQGSESERELFIEDQKKREMALEVKQARESAIIQRKQAKLHKVQAINEIGINTGIAISKTWAELGWPWALAFTIPLAAAGIAEQVAVAQAPLPTIPAYEKGGLVGENSPIITSEAGYELAVKPNGTVIRTGDKGAEVRTDIPKGSFVIPHHISKALDKQGFDASGSVNESSVVAITKVIAEKDRQNTVLLSQLLRSNDVLADVMESSVSNIPQTEVNITDRKLKHYIKQNGNRTTKWQGINKF